MKFYQRVILAIALPLFLIITACSRPHLTTVEGQTIPLTELKGHWVVINYWATWCKPCLTELPEFNSFAEAQKNNRVLVFGVSFDRLSDEQIRTFSKSLHINFPLFSHFPLDNYGIKNINTLPVTFIINPQGKLIKTLNGPQTSATLNAAIQGKST